MSKNDALDDIRLFRYRPDEKSDRERAVDCCRSILDEQAENHEHPELIGCSDKTPIGMAATTEESWWRSPRTWVGGTALADLGARAPGDFIAPLLSISGGLVGGTIVGTVTTWLLAATVFYWFAPLAYSMSDHLPRKDPAFRAIFAGGGVALGIVWWFGTFNHTAPITIPWVGAVMLLLTGAAITGSLVLWYLSSVHGWDLSNPHGLAFEMMALRNPDKDARAELELSFERYGAGIPLLALAMILGAPAVFAGVVMLIFILAYPIIDFLILGFLVGAAISARVEFGPSKDQVLNTHFDIEGLVEAASV